MSDMTERGFDAMRELRLACDELLREAEAEGSSEPSPEFPRPTRQSDSVTTPSGLEVTKIGDFLTASAEFEETNNGMTYGVTYDVEFPADMREWPSVYRWVDADSKFNRRTIPRKKFYEVAGLLSGLIVSKEEVA